MLRKFKLAAIDLDGTLLGHDSKISSANLAAVLRLENAGVHVVLASGRHYKSMRPYADVLPGVEWIISCQGGEVSNLNRTEFLTAEFLPMALVKETLDLGVSLGFTTVAYGVDEIFTGSDWNADLQFYKELSGCHPVYCHSQEFLNRQIYKLIWMGSSDEIERTVQTLPVNTAVIERVRTHKRFLEFMPAGISKASGLKLLAARLGVEASEVIAFGDGDNDVPMFEWAGVSVAMAHGWPAALRKATYTTGEGPEETALARGIELLFERKLLVA